MIFAQAKARQSSPGGSRRRAAFLAVTALTVLPLAASCSGSGSATNNQSPGSTSISIAAIPGVDTAPLYYAYNSGNFARAGLDVHIRSYPSVSAELQALSKGTVDIAAGDYVDFFALAASSKHPYLSVVADGYHAGPGVMEVLTLPHSGITSAADLPGKIVGTARPQGIAVPSHGAPFSIETLAAESVLANDGLNRTSVHWQAMQASNLIPALRSHSVAAILVQEPYIIQAETQLGAVSVLDACSGATANLPLSGYFTTSAWERDHSSAVATFRSVLKSAQEAASLPGPVRNQLAHEPNMSMSTASLVTIGSYPTILDAASLQRVADLMFNYEMLNQSLNVSTLISH